MNMLSFTRQRAGAALSLIVLLTKKSISEMAKDPAITGQLKIGDIVHVDNPILKEEYSNYPVLEIRGSIAITKFRKFHVNIYHRKYVYEYGKRFSGIYNNTYTVKDG